MRILNKAQFQKLMEEYPDGGIVFADYTPDCRVSDIMVTDGDFGATILEPMHGEVFDFDWNILEYTDDRQFIVYENNDVLQIIQTLVRGLKIELRDWYED